MSTHMLEIPFAVDLTHENAWLQNDGEKYIYFVARLHLLVESSQYSNQTYPGEILAVYQTTPKSTTKATTTVERELSYANIDETVCSQLMSETLATGVTSEILALASAPLYSLSGKVGASIERTLQTALNVEHKVSKAVTYSQMRRFEIQNQIFQEADEKIHAVACYRHMRQDVFLRYIDYLFVKYEASFFGLRKKKRNLPRPVGRYHVNRILINIPLFSMLNWELLSESSVLMTSSDYQQSESIVNPDEIEIIALDRRIHLPLPHHPERPTLYTLSNIAFPRRWIDRKGEWTREELAKIEMEDSEGSYWWFQYGPGRDKKRK